MFKTTEFYISDYKRKPPILNYGKYDKQSLLEYIILNIKFSVHFAIFSIFVSIIWTRLWFCDVNIGCTFQNLYYLYCLYDLWQVDGFLRVLKFPRPPQKKTDRHDILFESGVI